MIYFYLRKRLPLPVALGLAALCYGAMVILVLLCLSAPEARFLYGRL